MPDRYRDDLPLEMLAKVCPTRVRRNYTGGLLLERLTGVPNPHDSDRPEDWIASTTPAVNPGLPPEPGEGLTLLQLRDGRRVQLGELVMGKPEFYLGANADTGLGFLAKLLDSSMRLHVQAHPTSAFAREKLGAPFGKLEVYYVLDTRIPNEAYLRLGFQRSPGRDGWKKIIETQDIAAMDACFDRVPLAPGDVWIVPGGLPHAIGEGVLMVEIMEPSDLVVRCEFEREGIVVPEGGRFMGKGLDFCLDIFDYRSRSVEEIRKSCKLVPTPLLFGPGWTLERLVGADRTSSFEVQRLTADSPCRIENGQRAAVVVQTRGSGVLEVAGESLALRRGETAFIAAAAKDLHFTPASSHAEWLLCRPALRK